MLSFVPVLNSITRAQYTQALKLRPRDPFANANMGATYSELGQYTLAIQFFELALHFQASDD